MKHKSILLDQREVKGLLDGTITLLRRPVMPQPPSGCTRAGLITDSTDGKGIGRIGFVRDVETMCDRPLPYQPGDIIYGKETWRLVDFMHIDGDWSASVKLKDNSIGARLHSLTDDEKLGWRSSVHMPSEAARIFLLIKCVKVERVQDVSVGDITKEGSYLDRCPCLPHKNDKTPFEVMFRQTGCHIHGEEYKSLWNSRYDKRGIGWDTNPWTFAYEVELTVKPEVWC